MDTVGHEAKTQNTKQRFWRDWPPMEKMTLVLAVFAVIYSLVTLGLYSIASRQLDGMRKDQRPWIRIWTQVGVQQTPGTPQGLMPDKTTPLAVQLNILNAGKFPAKYVKGEIFIESVKNGGEPQLKRSPSFALASFTTGIIFPNVPQQYPRPYTLLQADWEDYKEGGSFLVIYSHTAYKDSFQTEHWADTCEFNSAKPGAYSAENCTDYNNADDN